MSKLRLLLCTSYLVVSNLAAQTLEKQLQWVASPLTQETIISVCTTCVLGTNESDFMHAYYTERLKGLSHLTHDISLSDLNYSVLDFPKEVKNQAIKAFENLRFSLFVDTDYDKQEPYLFYRFPVVKLENGVFYKLDKFIVNITPKLSSLPLITPNSRRGAWPNQSVLASGQWFRVAVDKEGVYKMDRSFLESLGVPVANLDPRTIRVFGHHGDLLPEKNDQFRYKDLQELPIWVAGEQDGRFDNNDFVLFYANAPSKFMYDSVSNSMLFSKHFYARESVYFIQISETNGRRMRSVSANQNAPFSYTVEEFDEAYRHERDLVNHIKSGRKWYGEHFDRTLRYTLSHTFANRVESSPVFVRTEVVARSLQPSSFTFNINDSLRFLSVSPLMNLDYSSLFVSSPFVRSFTLASVRGNTISCDIAYSKPLSTSEGWLDYLELHVKRRMIHAGSQTVFYNLESTRYPSARFVLEGPETLQFWDISNPMDPAIQQTSFNTNSHRLVTETLGKLKKYISFNVEFIPKPLGRVTNQNLHAIRDVQYVIVTAPEFLTAAEDLARFHREKNGLSTIVVTTRQLYNEFSCGIQDISAIRDFLKMLWDEASTPNSKPQYLLLFGDASYDYLDILSNNTNFVPTYQSDNSNNPNFSFCSDDYFALMNDNEGEMNLPNGKIGMLDLSVGRLVVSSLTQANAMVAKVKRYHSEEAFGAWRNEYTFVADDMDHRWEDIFVRESELYSKLILEERPASIINPIYLDAFEQKSLGGGERYPGAVEAINNGIERGTLFWNYNGHGGTFGLASERVIEIPQINNWKNRNRLPLFMTATCEFSRYDDPGMVSGGEHVLLNPEGGAIGLLTTTRLVLVTQNSSISFQYFNEAFFAKDANGRPASMGEIYRRTMNGPNQNTGDRFFTFLGDPAVRLAVPSYPIVLDSLNGKAFSTGSVDTLKALSKVVFKGRVLDDNNQTKSDFNGIVFPVVLDKPVTMETRSNDPAAVPVSYLFRNTLLFRGRSQAQNGHFEFQFIVPKDINYRFDTANISLYANNALVDAAGFENTIVVGGSVDSFAKDDVGPVIELFMNDFTFVNGGITGKSPLFIARLSDVSGISTAGSGIGREIIAIIDKGTKTERSIVLNEYYQADLNSYAEGEIRYRLTQLSEGKHTITLKAWDVHNNSSEMTMEFVVEASSNLVVRNVLNYPNPFSTRTTFHFDHNKPGQPLSIQLQIMTIGGKVVKQFFTEEMTASAHLNPFEWDALDEFGDKLSKGVYLYRLRVKSESGEWVEKYEKLLILN